MSTKARLLANLITSSGDVKAANLDNATTGASVTFIDSDGLLPSADLTGDSGDLIFSRSSNAIFVGEGRFYRRFSTNSLVTAEILMVAGGGGGSGGGGGAGGLLYYGSEQAKTPNGSALEIDAGKTY